MLLCVLFGFVEFGEVGVVGGAFGGVDGGLLCGVGFGLGDGVHGLAADGGAGAEAEFSGVEVPVVEVGGVVEHAGVEGVGVDAVAVGERAPVPFAVGFFLVGDAPVAAADLDGLGGVLVFGAVVDEDAGAGFHVGVAAGFVHDLVDAVDEVAHVGAGAGGGVVPCSAVGDEFVECLLLCGESLGVGLADVAEGDFGVGEWCEEVFFGFEDAALEAQGWGEGGVGDLGFVAEAGAFGAEAGLLEGFDGGGVADGGCGEGFEFGFGEVEEFLGVVAVGEVDVGDAGLAGAVGVGDAPLLGGGGVFDVFFAVVDAAEVDFAAVASGGLSVGVGGFDAFAPAVEAGDDVAGVDGAADFGQVLAVFEAAGGVGLASSVEHVDDASADAVHVVGGLDFGLDFEPVGVGDALDGFEDGAVVEGEVRGLGEGAGVHGAGLPAGVFEGFVEAGLGGGVPVAFVLDVRAGEFRDAVGGVGDGDGDAAGAFHVAALAYVFVPLAEGVLEDDSFVLADLAEGGDVQGVGAVGRLGADGADRVGQVAQGGAPSVEDHEAHRSDSYMRVRGS